MGRTKTKPVLKRKNVPKLYFHFWPPQKVSSLLLFNTYLVMWKYNCEPLWCNQCLSPPKLWVRIPLMSTCTRYKLTTLCDKVWHWLVAGQGFSPGTPVSSTNETDGQNITEILLKGALNTIDQTDIIKLFWYLIHVERQ
jgi:hypothetical protein